MEEKKVCPECENKEHKLEMLTQEEADKVVGGAGKPAYWRCSRCMLWLSYTETECPECGYEYES